MLVLAVRKIRRWLARDAFIRNSQTPFLLLADLTFVFFSLLISAALCEPDFSAFSSGFLLKNMVVFTLVTASVFLLLRLYDDPHDLSEAWPKWLKPSWAPRALAIPLVCAWACALPFLRFLGQMERFSVITPVFNIFLQFLVMGGTRLFLDAWNEHKNQRRIRQASTTAKQVRVLLVGTFQDLTTFLAGSQRQEMRNFNFLAAVTTSSLDCGRYISEVPVLGIVEDLPELLKPTGKKKQTFPYIVVVGRSLSWKTLQAVSRAANEAKVPVLTFLRPRRIRTHSLDEISQK